MWSTKFISWPTNERKHAVSTQQPGRWFSIISLLKIYIICVWLPFALRIEPRNNSVVYKVLHGPASVSPSLVPTCQHLYTRAFFSVNGSSFPRSLPGHLLCSFMTQCEDHSLKKIRFPFYFLILLFIFCALYLLWYYVFICMAFCLMLVAPNWAVSSMIARNFQFGLCCIRSTWHSQHIVLSIYSV